jgi:hypothetical protein
LNVILSMEPPIDFIRGYQEDTMRANAIKALVALFGAAALALTIASCGSSYHTPPTTQPGMSPPTATYPPH